MYKTIFATTAILLAYSNSITVNAQLATTTALPINTITTTTTTAATPTTTSTPTPPPTTTTTSTPLTPTLPTGITLPSCFPNTTPCNVAGNSFCINTSFNCVPIGDTSQHMICGNQQTRSCIVDNGAAICYNPNTIACVNQQGTNHLFDLQTQTRINLSPPQQPPQPPQQPPITTQPGIITQ